MNKKKLDELKADFSRVRDPEVPQDGAPNVSRVLSLSREHPDVYPSQGLLKTPFDYLDYSSIHMLPLSKIEEALRVRNYFLRLFNHPYRIHFLMETNKQSFTPPKKLSAKVFARASQSGLTLSIGDLAAQVVGANSARQSRTERYAQGPFVKLGRQARIPFVGSASPDVWNSALSVATMAASHALTCVTRNGLLSDAKRQSALSREIFEILDETANEVLTKEHDKKLILNMWQKNVMGTLEADPDRALSRASKLIEAGVTTFRVYSPEPGTGPTETLKALRKEYKNKIEIFVGQIIDIAQAQKCEEEGADGIYIGIGGGGRCITGVRSGSAIDWPSLVWNLRGKIGIPCIVEGGASDHIAVTLLLGASGIGVTRVVGGGTLESPGGALFCVDHKGKLFKPYGGEASARTKYLDGKLLPFGIPSFVEGETTKAYLNYVKHAQSTLTYNLHLLLEDAILALVFRNVRTIEELQAINPSPLMQSTSMDLAQRGVH